MKLKYILPVFLFGMVQSLKQEHLEKLKKWHMECYEETNVNPELVLKLKTGDWSMNNSLLKKWMLCVLNKYGLMSKEGVFKLDTALSMVPSADKEMLEDYIESCLPKKAMTPRNIAWAYAKCYHTKAREPRYKDKRLHYLAVLYKV